MLDLWEDQATHAITAGVNGADLDGRGQLFLLVDTVSVRAGDAVGGIEIEPALRDWGRTDPVARSVLERVDQQRLTDVQGFLRAAGVSQNDLAPRALLIYAAVIGLENLRMTTGTDMGQPLRTLVERLLDPQADGSGDHGGKR
jgi:hypothetical protein